MFFSSFIAKGLGELSLASNNLRTIPADIKRLSTLTKLDLSRNGLRCSSQQDYSGIPSEISELVNLEELKISECNLPYIPPAVWHLTTLKVLDVSRNKINVLLPEIGNLTGLQKLNLQQTNISSLPPEIAYCQDLEEITLWGNAIETLPETLPEMPKLRTLSLNYCSFCGVVDNYMENLLRKGQIKSEHIPIVVFELAALEVLDLENTKINNLPEIYNTNLKEFYLNKNFLQTVPIGIYNMKVLQVLDISKNLLSSLPEEISQLQSLEILSASHNNFERLPLSIGQLQNLKELNLASNKIRHLPVTIRNLKKLKTLILDRNELVMLPDEICELTELETLDLTRNNIQQLPIKINELKKITEAHSYKKYRRCGLWLYKNPLTQPPHEIWKTEQPHKIFDYMKKLQISKTENRQRKKLFVVGESQAGKTSLVNAMMAHNSILSDANTRVLEQTMWSSENKIEFCIRDFGGNEAYWMIYPLFLDVKGLYLLVYDQSQYCIEKHYDMIGSWLYMLSVHVPGAIVKLVGSKCDLCEDQDALQKMRDLINEQVQQQLENQKTCLQEELKKVQNLLNSAKSDDTSLLQHLRAEKRQLENLLSKQLHVLSDIALVSSTDGIPGVLDLENSIELLSIDKTIFPHIQFTMPAHWNKLRIKLKQTKSHYLLWEEVEAIAGKLHIVWKELTECLQYLQDVGEVLWYRNRKGLSKILFHKPQTLVDIISYLYHHDLEKFFTYSENKVFRSKGNLLENEFLAAKDVFLKHGQISRPLLKSFLFHLNLTQDGLSDMLELLPLLGICYIVPEPEVPPGKNFCQPLMILPWFNREVSNNDLEQLWTKAVAECTIQKSINYRFATGLPECLFLEYVTYLQDLLLTRIDWRDGIFAETENEKILIRKQEDVNTIAMTIEISICGSDDSQVTSLITETTQALCNSILKTAGVVWRVDASPEVWESDAIRYKPMPVKFSGNKDNKKTDNNS